MRIEAAAVVLLVAGCDAGTFRRATTPPMARTTPFPGPCSAAGFYGGGIRFERQYSYDADGRLLEASSHWLHRSWEGPLINHRFTERWTYDTHGRPIDHQLAPIPTRIPDLDVEWTCARWDEPEAKIGWERWVWLDSHVVHYEGTGIGLWYEQACVPNRWVGVWSDSEDFTGYQIHALRRGDLHELPETISSGFLDVAEREAESWTFERKSSTIAWISGPFGNYNVETELDRTIAYRVEDGRVEFLARDDPRAPTGSASPVTRVAGREWTWRFDAAGRARRERSKEWRVKPTTWIYHYDDRGLLRRISGEVKLEWDAAGNLIRADDIELDYGCWPADAPARRPNTDLEYTSLLSEYPPQLLWLTRSAWDPVVAPGLWAKGLGPLSMFDSEGPLRRSYD